MKVNRRGDHRSIRAENTKIVLPDFHLIAKVKPIHQPSRCKYGARRMSAPLLGRYKARHERILGQRGSGDGLIFDVERVKDFSIIRIVIVKMQPMNIRIISNNLG
jgi:hypothetical protein